MVAMKRVAFGIVIAWAALCVAVKAAPPDTLTQPPAQDTAKTVNASPRGESPVAAKPAPKLEQSILDKSAPKVEPSKVGVNPVHSDGSTNQGTGGAKPKIPEGVAPPADLKDVLRSEDDLYNGCSAGKRCLALPTGCLQTRDCDAAVAVWGLGGGRGYTIDLLGRLPRGLVKYVAIGFSQDPLMGDDHVVECVQQELGSPVRAFRSYNLPADKSNTREKDQSGISLELGTYVEGTIYCRIHHNSSLTVQGTKMFDLEKMPYHLLLAAGTDLAKDSVGYHSTAISSQDKALIPNPPKTVI